jgi:O-antigen ligase
VISLGLATNLQRGLEVILFTAYVFGVFFLVLQITHEDNKNLLLRCLFIVSAVVGVFGLYQFLGDVFGLSTSLIGLRDVYTKAVLGYPRTQATFLEPLYFGNFLILPITLLFVAQLKDWNIISKFWRHILLILLGVVFILTISRGAYLGLAGAILIAFLLLIKGLNWHKLIAVIGDGVLIILLSFVLVWFAGWYQQKNSAGQPGLGRKTINNFTGHAVDRADGSVNERKSTYNLALRAWKKSPIFGIGIGNFGEYTAKQSSIYSPKQIVNNETLEVLSETGLVGLLAILGFLVSYFMSIFKVGKGLKEDDYKRWYLVGMGAAVFGILVQYQFFSTLYIVPIWFVFGWLGGLVNLSHGRKNG